MIQDTAAAIEPGHFPKGHPWYGSYQEMGTIMVCITQAKLDLLEGLPQNAIKNLEEAARLQHDMPYMEPEVFYTPGTGSFFPPHAATAVIILTAISLNLPH